MSSWNSSRRPGSSGVSTAAPTTARYGSYNAPSIPKRESRHHTSAAAAPAAGAAAASQYQYGAAAADSSPYNSASRTTPSKNSSGSSFITQVSRAVPKPSPISRNRNGAMPKAIPRLPVRPGFQGRPLLVLDLDETLVHASVEPVPHDVSFRVPMENQVVVVYVKLRPGVNEFLRQCARLFEVAVFTASLSQYADQVVDYLDPEGVFVHHRLFREHCTMVDGSYVKDLSLIGRPMETICIVDNSPIAYSFHTENALAITSWFDCPRDRELYSTMQILRDFASTGNVYESVTNGRFDLL